ncbi:MAG: (2Fe-2S)-binding protein [Proteobacteria bacterium]|nr:(2Fe-2S)-binding protein [Pseudomonadota bacterium]MBU1387305.1 (2Fe-2S)-binding protein [Pseudomonadota bacterium]MBU1544287.1 (2Fe-2S)-binding protein [Pseudomonadota bacterium]MBU2430316.1 (2Fe-2S)-binding protein [Pseudomonadota bacterium]MBU2481141.1 (2Fe-2S)-binding protein [Pseudomonadota bacterium]
MTRIYIDDMPVEAKTGQTVLQAAKANNIAIPHLCFHPALSPSGACRLCGVDVFSKAHSKWILVMSCVLKVKENLTIRTQTEQVHQARIKAFNRLLQMAPESERIRALAQKFNIDVAPAPNGCTGCRLCIRVCNEIVRASALKMKKTKQGHQVVAEPGKCIGCGTCANLCPTGVIRIKDEDKVRTVFLKGETVCQLPLERCEGCGSLYATISFIDHVREATHTHPDTKEHHSLCPACIKLMSNRALTEKERIKK